MVSTLIGSPNPPASKPVWKPCGAGARRSLENNHTVILGCRTRFSPFISELIIANENRKQGAVIVVMAAQEK